MVNFQTSFVFLIFFLRSPVHYYGLTWSPQFHHLHARTGRVSNLDLLKKVVAHVLQESDLRRTGAAVVLLCETRLYSNPNLNAANARRSFRTCCGLEKGPSWDRKKSE